MANPTLTENEAVQVLVESATFLTHEEREPAQIVNQEGNVIESPFRNCIEALDFLYYFFPGPLSEGLRVVAIEE